MNAYAISHGTKWGWGTNKKQAIRAAKFIANRDNTVVKLYTMSGYNSYDYRGGFDFPTFVVLSDTVEEIKPK